MEVWNEVSFWHTREKVKRSSRGLSVIAELLVSRVFGYFCFPLFDVFVSVENILVLGYAYTDNIYT